MLEVGKNYLTRDGFVAKVNKVDQEAVFGVYGYVYKGVDKIPCSWNKQGFLVEKGFETVRDIISHEDGTPIN